MSSSDTNNIGIRLQAAGENLNTWGDPYLNNDLIVLSKLVSGFVSLTINGDYTVSETLYSTTNDTENALIKLVAGTVAAAFNFTIPGRMKRFTLWNATAYAATVKLSATTGFALPAGGFAEVSTNGTTDTYNVSPTHCGTSTQATANNAYALWGAVQTAIANAALPATAGTVRIAATDTTAGYPLVKFLGEGSITVTQRNTGANEYLGIGFTFDEGQTALYAGVMAL